MDYQTIKIFNEKFDEWIDTPVKRSNGRFEETPGVSFIWPQMNPVGTEYKEILSGNETGYGFVLVAVFVPLFDGELAAAAICDKIRDMFKGFVSGPVRCGKRSIVKVHGVVRYGTVQNRANSLLSGTVLTISSIRMAM